MSNEIEAVIKNLPTKKNSGLSKFTAEFHQACKEELTAMFLKLFHKTEREGTLPKSFYEVKITVIPKLKRDSTKKNPIDQFPW
jgi:nitrate reductase assembly molybdenum cofactor insertion protein NarJ